jgi:REP element-mobilizing transposase RayT
MARPRKRHIQQELFRHGGKRRGAGRPPKGPRPREKHKRRPTFKASQPIHVTLRVAADIGRLRTRELYKAIRWATVSVAEKHEDRFRIVHMSIQGNHLHLIVEAEDRMALARGMQGFEISAAKHINAAMSRRRRSRRRGTVFTDRYHARILNSPTSAKRAIAYVLNNWRRHRQDRGSSWLVDPYSSGISFPGWKELEGALWMWRPSDPRYQPLLVFQPKTWLLRTGWELAGPIRVRDVPGPVEPARAAA